MPNEEAAPPERESGGTDTLSLRPGQASLREQAERAAPDNGLRPAASSEPPLDETPAPQKEDVPEVKTIFLGPQRRAKDQAALPIARLLSDTDRTPATVTLRRPPSATPEPPAKPVPPPPVIPPPPSPATAGPAPATEPAPPATPAEEASGVACPRCSARLVNPGNLGWCPKCGYCQLLEEDQARAQAVPVVQVKPQVSLLGMMEFVELVRWVPVWLLILVGGLMGTVVVSFIGHAFFPPETSGRNLWATAQFLIGLFVFLTGQVWALALIAPHEEKISPKDLLLLSGRLWGAAYQRLPATRWPIWLACWGAALIALDVVLIGGLSQEFRLAGLSFQKKIAAVRSSEGGGDPSAAPATGPAEEEPSNLSTFADLALTPLTGVSGWLVGSLPWFAPPQPPPPPPAAG